MKEFKKRPPVDRDTQVYRPPTISEPARDPARADLRSAGTVVPSNAGVVSEIVDGLQHTHGNRFVQRLLSVLHGPAPAPDALDAATRARMEAQLGEDFSNVRVHAGPEAAARADAAGARAVAEGEDIYFGEGEYAPDTPDGRALLAHELAHVVQQRPAAMAAGGMSPEHEAEHAETGATEGTRTEVARRGLGPTAQRKDKATEKAKKEEPSVLRHPVEIGPVPPAGSFSAAGRFAIAYVFAAGQPQALTLQVPAGVTTAVTALSDVSDLKVGDSGAGARAVEIAVSPVEALARIQVAFVQGSATYLVVFNFMKAALPPPHKAAPPQ